MADSKSHDGPRYGHGWEVEGVLYDTTWKGKELQGSIVGDR